jgi:hypothetical protein
MNKTFCDVCGKPFDASADALWPFKLVSGKRFYVLAVPVYKNGDPADLDVDICRKCIERTVASKLITVSPRRLKDMAPGF